MLRDGEHCAFYDDAASCISQCTKYLPDSAERNRMRMAGELRELGYSIDDMLGAFSLMGTTSAR